MLTMTRSRLRWTVVAAGVLLLAGLRLAPSLPPALSIPVSLAWLALLGFLLYAAYTVLGDWLRPEIAAGIGVIAARVTVAVIPMVNNSWSILARDNLLPDSGLRRAN